MTKREGGREVGPKETYGVKDGQANLPNIMCVRGCVCVCTGCMFTRAPVCLALQLTKDVYSIHVNVAVKRVCVSSTPGVFLHHNAIHNGLCLFVLLGLLLHLSPTVSLLLPLAWSNVQRPESQLGTKGTWGKRISLVVLLCAQ